MSNRNNGHLLCLNNLFEQSEDCHADSRIQLSGRLIGQEKGRLLEADPLLRPEPKRVRKKAEEMPSD